MKSTSAFVTSRYNFRVPIDGGALLYNSGTGDVLRFTGPDALTLAGLLSGTRIAAPAEVFPPEVYAQLTTGGFLIPGDKDELEEIRQRFNRARTDTPLVLTITATMDCNLGCYYCYEERSADKLESTDVEQIVELTRRRLASGGKESLHVDWYGGEPLMNIQFVEAASLALQELCRECEVSYSASVISNGTSWPGDVGGFIQRHKVRQVQISFDGLRDNHNKRRRFRSGYASGMRASSFDLAVELVDELLSHVRVDIRINVDRGNQDDVIPFIRFARSRGWFNREYPAVIQPARLSAYSERSSFMRRAELTLDEYDRIRASVRAEVNSETSVEESEAPDLFPHPKSSVCAALALDSVVVGADRRQYRCGLQVGEAHRAVGNIGDKNTKSLPILNQTDELWWERFDPTNLENCSRCSFLPVCWGGCPKKHLEQDAQAIAEQGAYWRKNLPRLVAEGVGEKTPDGFTYTEQDQFRT